MVSVDQVALVEKALPVEGQSPSENSGKLAGRTFRIQHTFSTPSYLSEVKKRLPFLTFPIGVFIYYGIKNITGSEEYGYENGVGAFVVAAILTVATAITALTIHCKERANKPLLVITQDITV
jgi:hypothetical protein